MLVETIWEGKMSLVAGDDKGNTFKMDTSPKVGGEEKGVTPMAALLGAMSGCISMDTLAMLRRSVDNGEIQSFRVEADGTQNDEHPKYFTDIDVILYVEGSISAERVWGAFRKSEEKYCSVRHSLKADVTLKLVLNGKDTPELN
ncbi:OsmC family protein [Alkalibacterium putridalgicola]|uniref:OsmC family protein n=1 Tax=Alkalibacterium putridalgicola TaxID=426703 RepID=UPI0034CFE1B6